MFGTRDYPRACGVTISIAEVISSAAGLSPRMRGHHLNRLQTCPGVGTIPAHAGSPPMMRRIKCRTWDYPRACGVTYGREIERKPSRGLSPRMRGHLADDANAYIESRTIPAHAGSPTRCCIWQIYYWDYPRACGVTRPRDCPSPPTRGLSPRMRGHQTATVGANRRPGTIPAHAGSPR